jgi:hypothetical protein
VVLLFGALCGAVAFGAVLALLVRHGGGATVVDAASPNPGGYPTPPAGSVVLARPLGEDDLGVGLLRTATGIHVQASVVNGSGDGVAGLAVTIGGADAVACGPGCYSVDLGSAPRRLAVRVGTRGVTFAVPDLGRSRDGGPVVEQTNRSWSALRSLVVHDRLSSGTGVTLKTLYTMVAPDRLTYAIEGEGQAVIIGRRRWDRVGRDARWRESSTTPVRQPQHPWTAAVDAHVLAETARATRISFFDPGTPGWFEIEVERSTGRTLWMRMTAPAHFMVERYSRFDRPIRIEAPTTTRSRS